MSLYYIFLGIILITALVIYMLFKRNFTNKHKYVRIEKYTSDKHIKITYMKREDFEKDKSILVNPNHIFIYNGYTTVIITSNSQESINPLDFKSRFSPEMYKSAIRSKLIGDTFETLKPDKIDKMMLLLLLNAFQIIVIVYLAYALLGGGTNG